MRGAKQRFDNNKAALIDLRIVNRTNYTAWKVLQNVIALKAPSTRYKYNCILKEFAGFLGSFLEADDLSDVLLSVTTDEARQYVGYIRTRPAQSGRSAAISDRVCDKTVRLKVVLLASLYGELVDARFLPHNPFTSVVKETPRGTRGLDRRPSELMPYDKIESLFELAGKDKTGIRDKAILAFLFGGAMRRGEIVTLKLSDVRVLRDTVVIRLRKTKAQVMQEQVIGFGAEYVCALVEQRKKEGAKETDFLITNYTRGTNRASENHISDTTLYLIFKRYCAKAGLSESFTPHCARATSITKLLDDGHSHRDVMTHSRHASVEMVEHYDKRRTDVEDSISKNLTFAKRN